MSKMWRREKLNPLEWMERLWPDADLSHIKFNPDAEFQYFRAKQGGGDGTLLFFYQDMAELLAPFGNMTTFYKPDQPDGDLSGYGRIEYELGWVRAATVYGSIKLRCSETQTFPGEKYRMRVRVRATLFPKEQKP